MVGELGVLQFFVSLIIPMLIVRKNNGNWLSLSSSDRILFHIYNYPELIWGCTTALPPIHSMLDHLKCELISSMCVSSEKYNSYLLVLHSVSLELLLVFEFLFLFQYQNYVSFLFALSKRCIALRSKAKFRRRTSHEPNRMQMSKILCSPSFAFDSAHVKYGVWTWPKLRQIIYGL